MSLSQSLTNSYHFERAEAKVWQWLVRYLRLHQSILVQPHLAVDDGQAQTGESTRQRLPLIARRGGQLREATIAQCSVEQDHGRCAAARTDLDSCLEANLPLRLRLTAGLYQLK